MEYCSALRRNEVGIHTTWIKLNMPSEIRHKRTNSDMMTEKKRTNIVQFHLYEILRTDRLIQRQKVE